MFSGLWSSASSAVCWKILCDFPSYKPSWLGHGDFPAMELMTPEGFLYPKEISNYYPIHPHVCSMISPSWWKYHKIPIIIPTILPLKPPFIGDFPCCSSHGAEFSRWLPEGIAQLLTENVHMMFQCTLWLCQNSYWKLPFIVDFPIKNGDFP